MSPPRPGTDRTRETFCPGAPPALATAGARPARPARGRPTRRPPLTAQPESQAGGRRLGPRRRALGGGRSARRRGGLRHGPQNTGASVWAVEAPPRASRTRKTRPEGAHTRRRLDSPQGEADRLCLKQGLPMRGIGDNVAEGGRSRHHRRRAVVSVSLFSPNCRCLRGAQGQEALNLALPRQSRCSHLFNVPPALICTLRSSCEFPTQTLPATDCHFLRSRVQKACRS